MTWLPAVMLLTPHEIRQADDVGVIKPFKAENKQRRSRNAAHWSKPAFVLGRVSSHSSRLAQFPFVTTLLLPLPPPPLPHIRHLTSP